MLSALDHLETPRHWAIGRILSGGHPLWPGLDETPISLLQLWLGHRRKAGLRLQTFASLNEDRPTLFSLAKKVLSLPIPTPEEEDYWVHHLARDWARVLARVLVRDWARVLAYDWARAWSHDWARDWDLDKQNSNHFDFAWTEYRSYGRTATCYFIAQNQPEDKLIGLFYHASNIHYGREEHMIQLETSLQNYQGDPLWPALARHVARCATDEDKKLLENLAKNPELREPPLQWGLKYIVRGDVMLADGSEITLDEMCDELGLPQLPYLEEMPPLLEID
ncbi:MAG: hypothetical protein HQM03_08690 [Magnetococcales bacterium]|nr:hypothetical protein [Magnetococcales bacterium]